MSFPFALNSYSIRTGKVNKQDYNLKYTQEVTLVKNKRRVEVATGTSGAGATNFIDMDFEKGQTVNIHGLRVEVILEPEDADANSTGIWAVWVLPGGVITNSDLPAAFGDFGNEDFAPYLWGIGVYAATNQTPGKINFEPKSTRNMQSGGRIVLELVTAGVSAGQVRHREVITCFTTPIM